MDEWYRWVLFNTVASYPFLNGCLLGLAVGAGCMWLSWRADDQQRKEQDHGEPAHVLENFALKADDVTGEEKVGGQDQHRRSQ